MPIVPDVSGIRRRSPRWWLLILGAVLALLIALPLAPFAVPVALHSGDRWLLVQTQRFPPGTDPVPPGTEALDLDLREHFAAIILPTGVEFNGKLCFTATSDFHLRQIALGRYNYKIEWFRGHPGWTD